jgi:hypothetical protein
VSAPPNRRGAAPGKCWRKKDEGQPVVQVNRRERRGPDTEVAAIDDPLLQLMGRLRGHFEVIRAVRFAHEGDK